MKPETILLILKSKLEECSNLLFPEIEKYFGENKVEHLSEEGLTYANKIHSVYTRINDILNVLTK